MPLVNDFRTQPFQLANVGEAGKFLGKTSYWKLYVIENSFRILIHSVLVAQIGPDWWLYATDKEIKRKTANIQRDYANQPQHTKPGRHEIYFVFLRDLNKIILANVNLFRPLIPDIDNWIARIETIRLPRNVIGHMNWLSSYDQSLVDELYRNVKMLIKRFSETNIPFSIP